MTLIGVTGEMCLQKARPRIARVLLASEAVTLPSGRYDNELLRTSANKVRAEVEVYIHHGSRDRFYQYPIDEYSVVLRRGESGYRQLVAAPLIGRTVICQRLYLPPIDSNLPEELIPLVFLDAHPEHAIAIDLMDYNRITVDSVSADTQFIAPTEFPSLQYQSKLSV